MTDTLRGHRRDDVGALGSAPMGPDSMDGRPLVVAHRGASHDRVENTVEAFAEARVQGAGWVELDVRLSADDVLMVHHDAPVSYTHLRAHEDQRGSRMPSSA